MKSGTSVLAVFTFQHSLAHVLSPFTVALERIIGVTPALMRPPYGSYNDVVRTVSAERGQDRESELKFFFLRVVCISLYTRKLFVLIMR